jgi:hypothetical protein
LRHDHFMAAIVPPGFSVVDTQSAPSVKGFQR